jgi:hypothetical protein
VSSRACGPQKLMKMVYSRDRIDPVRSGEIEGTLELLRPLVCLIRSVRLELNNWASLPLLWEAAIARDPA